MKIADTPSPTAPAESALADQSRVQALSLVVHELNNLLGETFMAIEDLSEGGASEIASREIEIAQKSLNSIITFLRSIAYVFSASQRRTDSFATEDATTSLNKILLPLLDKRHSTLTLEFPNDLSIAFPPGIFCSVIYDLLVNNNERSSFRLEMVQSDNTIHFTAEIGPNDRSWINTEAFLEIMPQARLETPNKLVCLLQSSSS